MKTTALIVAAGAGVRMGAARPKAFLELAGRPLLDYSLTAFAAHPSIDGIVLVVPEALLGPARALADRHPKLESAAAGGERRQDSVVAGLRLIAGASGAEADDLVLVHDAARPLVSPELIDTVIEAAARTGAAVPGLAPSDTVREVGPGPGGRIMAATRLDRDRLVLTQTPQGFRLGILRQAHERGLSAGGALVSDDASLVEALGREVEIVPGSRLNLKITSPEDMVVAAALLSWQRGE